MSETTAPSRLLFEKTSLVTAGDLLTVALAYKRAIQEGKDNLVIFEFATAKQIDVDVRGSEATLLKRFRPELSAATESGGPETVSKRRGRPKLGVVGREVTLLPRHWEWLDAQRGGASAALRKLEIYLYE